MSALSRRSVGCLVLVGLALSLAQGCRRRSAPVPPRVEPAWIVDPHAPGPSLPPVGRSLFDFLVGGDVPFPFPALLRAIEARLAPRPGSTRLQIVLIPRGRSLQRDAASPEFFRYPRVVVAADGASRPGDGPEIVLPDRLYLGYQEKAAVLEVISYNEAAGRFEFQVVRDYGPGRRPRLLYADRALCMTCHQNGAPIFSRPPWAETSANPAVAALVREHGPQYQGVPVKQGIDVPSRLDAATERANGLSAVQLLWREGCGGDDEPSRRCRGDLLTLALARALSGAALLDADAEAYRSRAGPRLREHVPARWPRGLRLPSPDIPNRDSRREADVGASVDPLLPRPPLETWSEPGGSEAGLVRWLSGLADFFAASDLHRLDAALMPRGGTPWEARATCRVAVSRRSAPRSRVSFQCAHGPGRDGAAFTGRVSVDQERVGEGSIDGIAIDGRDELPALEVRGGTLRGGADAWRLELEVRQAGSGLRPRRRDGRALDTLVLAWGSDPSAATASLAGHDDFEAIRKAVTALVPRTAAAGDAFGPAPFRRASVLAALEERLELSPVARCCLDPAGLPPAALDVAPALRPETATEAGLDPTVSRFRRYCSRCHETPSPFPANFLYGSPPEQQRGLDRCAERIAFRLGMWSLPADARPKTPMPPVTALPALDVDPGHWPEDAQLAALRQEAAERIRRRTGRRPVLSELASRGYSTLPTCAASDASPGRN
jgi:hypothetical protein